MDVFEVRVKGENATRSAILTQIGSCLEAKKEKCFAGVSLDIIIVI